MIKGRIEDLEKECEYEVVLKNVMNDVYSEDVLSDYNAKTNISDYPKLERYSQLLELLNRMARSTMSIECVGVWERVWDGKSIITIKSDSIYNSDFNKKLYDEFSYYITMLNELGITTEYYGFIENKNKFYRFIILDRTIAQGISIINDVIIHKEEGFFEKSPEDLIELFNKNVDTRIMTYKRLIS